jgi:hypothetical protein
VGAKNGFTHLQEQDGRKWKKKKTAISKHDTVRIEKEFALTM